MRNVLLAASRSSWLRERATRYRFVRRAVIRFMPGERLEDALEAARGLGTGRMSAIVTCLGENVSHPDEAAAVKRHYLEVFDKVSAMGLDVEVSVKLTHLGLDLSPDLAAGHVADLARRAAGNRSRLWIDMEDSSYTDATLDVYRKVRPAHPTLGVCLQSYLRRTQADLESLLPLGPSIRVVKGAYREPPDKAFPRKSDVDENFFKLSARLLSAEALAAGAWTVIGTHDPVLVDRIQARAEALGVARDGFEFDLLYGIRRDLQARLVDGGWKVRVLISYGSQWFPWYMRRLAERPANLWFVARGILAR
ncbi:MAG: proline dehydrogenase family protein [Candidatus Polarisedimenticolia bacterium]